MPALLKQPIVHFLLLATLLFGVYQVMNPDKGGDPDRIVIDDAALLKHLQYRTRSFDEAHAIKVLENMPRQEKLRIIGDLTREEVLYREAVAMALDQGDYVIRQRLVQKMEYLTRGFGAPEFTLSREAVEAYFHAHEERYREPPGATFTHVFVSGESAADASELQSAAEALLQTLNDGRVPFEQAGMFGDRFVYHANYVNRTRDLVASHFGEVFAEKLFLLAPGSDLWQGPLPSRYGLHLVLLSDRSPGGLPPLDAIYARVADDAKQAWVEDQSEQAVAALIEQYDVEVAVSGIGDETQTGAAAGNGPAEAGGRAR